MTAAPVSDEPSSGAAPVLALPAPVAALPAPPAVTQGVRLAFGVLALLTGVALLLAILLWQKVAGMRWPLRVGPPSTSPRMKLRTSARSKQACSRSMQMQSAQVWAIFLPCS